MSDYSLIIWLLLGAALAISLWFGLRRAPGRWRALRAEEQRRHVEDALKLIYNLQQEGQVVDQYRLAVEQKINLPAAQELISNLQAQQLIDVDQKLGLSLTTAGRRWALQVIRAHRLWERYLADEARMPLEQIHTAAHRREHQMSVDEVDALDAALGHPARDPHGDPIPNAAGDMRDDSCSTPLIQLESGQRGRINHLEDEPPLVYAQILAEGLYVGQSILMQENSPQRIVFTSSDNEYILAPRVAENISICLDIANVQPEQEVIPLDILPIQAKAEIVTIDDRCQGFTRRRFLDLGLTPGAVIYPELNNFFQDPRAYRVRGTLIALRHEQAGLIWVRALNDQSAQPSVGG